MIPLEKVNSIILRYDELENFIKTNIDKEFVKLTSINRINNKRS